MKSYSVIFFDLDDTLLDYQDAETNVMRRLFAAGGRPCSAQTEKELWEMSSYYWDKYRLTDSEDTFIQENYHALFYNYLADFMAELGRRYGFACPPERLQALFLEYLSQESRAVEGAEEVLRFFRERAVLMLASNGLEWVQKRRLGKLAPYFGGMLISEEAGVIKPGRRFWELALERAGCEPQNCLMVGDSLKNDILGAAAFGMDTCWVNRKGKERGGAAPTWEVRELREMCKL
ncbi:MAG: HAD-IA family hydrolase [Lachnospiraceae bacterium]|nr:HAD-IA family hydrolase [Lachnospiraceae bacterium]